MTTTWTVNGQRRTVDVPDDMPLLWVLRDVLHLEGTKYGCGMGLCGACTVHLDGQPTRACLRPAKAVGTQAITTIEGIAADFSQPSPRRVAHDPGHRYTGRLESSARNVS